MHPKDQFSADLKEAMKARDQVRLSVIRGTLAAIKDTEQRKRDDLLAAALQKHGLSKPVPGGHSDADTAAFEAALKVYSEDIHRIVVSEKIEESSALTEADVLSLVQKLIKQRQDSIADAQKAGRKDIEDAERKEMEILQTYLPQQMSREDIETEARLIIVQVGATSVKDMGKVMGPLMGKLQGRADGKLISEVVRSLLG